MVECNYLDQEQIGTVPGQEDGRRVSAVAKTFVDSRGIRVLPWLERQAVDTGEFEPAEFLLFLEMHQSIESEDQHVEDIWLLATELTDWHALDDARSHTGDGGEFSVFSAIATLDHAGEILGGDRDQGLDVVGKFGFTALDGSGEITLGDRGQSLEIGVFLCDASGSLWTVSISLC